MLLNATQVKSYKQNVLRDFFGVFSVKETDRKKSHLGEMGGSNGDSPSPLSLSPVQRGTSPSISDPPRLSRR